MAAELLSMHNAFHQGQYQTVIDSDTSSLSNENIIPARVLKFRARIANGQADEVIKRVTGDHEEVTDLVAVKALAQHTVGDTSAALQAVEQLISTSSENATVQIIGATVLQAEGKSEDALALLAKHEGSLEA